MFVDKETYLRCILKENDQLRETNLKLEFEILALKDEIKTLKNQLMLDKEPKNSDIN